MKSFIEAVSALIAPKSTDLIWGGVSSSVSKTLSDSDVWPSVGELALGSALAVAPSFAVLVLLAAPPFLDAIFWRLSSFGVEIDVPEEDPCFRLRGFLRAPEGLIQDVATMSVEIIGLGEVTQSLLITRQRY